MVSRKLMFIPIFFNKAKMRTLKKKCDCDMKDVRVIVNTTNVTKSGFSHMKDMCNHFFQI